MISGVIFSSKLTKAKLGLFLLSYKNDSSKFLNKIVSIDYPCQTYLVIETENKSLNIVNNDYLKQLAIAFRKAEFHESDMDKNTTLIIASERPDTEPLNSSSKVKIEDDPYYFKKYVFSYTSAGEQLATTFIEHRKTVIGNEISYVNEILNYLMDAEQFGIYKNKKDDLSTYSYFVELATKIPAFPLNIKNSEEIKSVDVFLAEQLKGKETDTELLDELVFSDIDFKEDTIELILKKYDTLVSDGSWR